MKRRLIKVIKPVVERFPRLAVLYRNIRDSWDSGCDPHDTPMGFKLAGNRMMENGVFEPIETEWVKKIIKDIDVFINVGANIGYYCSLVLNEWHDSVTVLAFEPILTNFKYLMKNVAANAGKNSHIELFPIALGNQTGIVKMFGGGVCASLIEGWEGINTAHSSFVPLNTLDNILGDRFINKRCFLLVDIEGAEFLMLKGSSSFLSREPKPVWMVEVCIGEHQPAGIDVNPHLEEIFDLFWKQGYESWSVQENPRKISADEISKIASTGKDMLSTHNFIFADAEWCERFFDM